MMRPNHIRHLLHTKSSDETRRMLNLDPSSTPAIESHFVKISAPYFLLKPPPTPTTALNCSYLEPGALLTRFPNLGMKTSSGLTTTSATSLTSCATAIQKMRRQDSRPSKASNSTSVRGKRTSHIRLLHITTLKSCTTDLKLAVKPAGQRSCSHSVGSWTRST